MAVRSSLSDSEMSGPVLKRFCSSTIKRIAVEGNIGKIGTDTGTNFSDYAVALNSATGKSTFLRILEEHSPDYCCLPEPISRWTNVPEEKEVC